MLKFIKSIRISGGGDGFPLVPGIELFDANGASGALTALIISYYLTYLLFCLVPLSSVSTYEPPIFLRSHLSNLARLFSNK